MIFNALIGGTSANLKKIVDGSITEIKESDLKGIEQIRKNAFADCVNLTSVVIPESVTAIGDFAFFGCNNLTTIICKATTPPTLDSSALYNVPITIPIYVPAESVEAYKSATNWSARADYIQAIEE